MAGPAAGKAYRVTWVDRMQARLAGPMNRRLAIELDPDWVIFGMPERGAALIEGRFGLGEPVPQPGANIWDVQCDSPARDQARHGFEWLEDLAALSGSSAHGLACDWVASWLNRHGLGRGPGWHVVVAAERLERLTRHRTWLCAGPEGLSRGRLERAMARHQRFILRRFRHIPSGRIGVCTMARLIVAGTALEHSDRLVARARAALEQQIARLVDPGGGIATRNPEELATLFIDLAMAARMLDLAGQAPGAEHARALDRMAPVLRALRLGDGALARFHGGDAGNAGALDAALSVVPRSETGPTHCPMGFMRLARGRSVLVMDAALPPLGVAGADAHASTLGFEMSSGRRPLIVNCGSGAQFGPDWHGAARETASHSTLVLDQHSITSLSPAGRRGRKGAADEDVQVELHDDRPEAHVVAAHNGYAERYGLIHVRRLDLDLSGDVLHGEELLSAVTEPEKRQFAKVAAGQGVPFALRFHLHPDVDAHLDAALGEVRLALPSGEHWRFASEGALTLRLDASVYLDNTRAEPRASRQIALEGRVRDFATTVRWRLWKETDTPSFLREIPRDGLLEDLAPGQT